MVVDQSASGMHLVPKWLVMANKEDAATLQMTENVTETLARSQLQPEFEVLSTFREQLI